MRILLITETVPYPLDSGGRIKTFHTLRALAHEHEVHCHAFVRNEGQRQAAVRPLSSLCASVTLHLQARSVLREVTYLARSLATGVPFTVTRHFDRKIMKEVARECSLKRIEAVYCDHLSMFEYGRRLQLPIVHDAHNIEHRIVRRFASSLPWIDPRRGILAREWRRLRAYERKMYARARLVFAVSDVDASEIRTLAGGSNVIPVPIAVDARGVEAVRCLTDRPQILFVGALDWPPNRDGVEFFLRHVWLRLRRQLPDAEFVVVGRGNESIRRSWGSCPGVRFVGWVPDPGPWFAESRALIVPLRSGSGMRVKVLDAFARGVPVVTTTIGVEGIDVRAGIHALVADGPDDLAAALLRLLQNRSLAESLAAAARQLVLERYDTSVVARLQLDAIRNVVSPCRKMSRGPDPISRTGDIG